MAAALLTATDAPPAGTWAIDPGRAGVAFSGRAGFLAPTISARFATVSGEVTVGAEHGVRVEVDVTSMTTGNRAWDDVLGAVDPFDTGRFPLAVYESTDASAVVPSGARIGPGAIAFTSIRSAASSSASASVNPITPRLAT